MWIIIFIESQNVGHDLPKWYLVDPFIFAEMVPGFIGVDGDDIEHFENQRLDYERVNYSTCRQSHHYVTTM